MRFLVGGTVLLIVAFGVWLMVAVPFLLPAPIYELVHGWRYPTTVHAGAATFVDHGPGASTARYQIHVPVQSSGPAEELVVPLMKLPKDEFHLGLTVPLSNPSGWKTEWEALRGSRAYVSLVDGRGTVVAEVTGALAGDFTWSGPYQNGAFLYQSGGAFDASSSARYVLRAKIENAEALPERSRVTIQGGGWK